MSAMTTRGGSSSSNGRRTSSAPPRREGAVPTAARRCVWVNGPIIVGGGPSGVAVSACLRARGVPSLVVERSDCLGSLWQRRTYDRLRLHLPKRFCSLPMLPFPDHYPEYPSRDQFVAYLHSYAQLFDVNPRLNERVEAAWFDAGAGVWKVTAVPTTPVGAQRVEYVGRWLVVATGENAEPVVPEWEGREEDYVGEVVHAADYRSGEAFEGKRVAVVGCGNSGMEVCLDLCHHGATPCMVVRDSVHVLPREILGLSTCHLSVIMSRYLPLWLVDKILVLAAWLTFGSMSKYGLRRPAAMGPLELKHRHGKTPVLDLGALRKIKSGAIDVVPAGIKRFTRTGVELVDGSTVDAEAIILATGYRSNVASWLQEAEMFAKEDGFPKESFPGGWKGRNGLYAVGFTRRGLLGASMDAVRIAEDIEKEWKEEMIRQRKKLQHYC